MKRLSEHDRNLMLHIQLQNIEQALDNCCINECLVIDSKGYVKKRISITYEDEETRQKTSSQE
jgi:hypothetical protein